MGILSKPKLNPEDELMGILGGMGQNSGWQALTQLGAGIAGNADKGWGAGIGAGLSGAGDALQQGQQQRMRGLGLVGDMQNQQARLKLAQAEAARGPAPTELVRNYQTALTQGFKGSLIDFQKAMRAGEGNRVPMGFQADPNNPEALSFVPGGPYDPAVIAEQSQARGRGRQFSVNDISKLTEQGSEFANVRDFGAKFQDSYGGYTPCFGGMNMAAARFGFGNENATNAAQWWQEYDRYKNKIRNDQFGATLTPSEQAEWLKADISPEMDPKIIKSNLATQKRLVEGAVKRKAAALIQAKYDPDVISEAYGINLGELGVDTNVRGAGATGGKTVSPALQEARDAIAKGAPREAVIQRLEQNGIDPSGL
jgi:hypothetical protein